MTEPTAEEPPVPLQEQPEPPPASPTPPFEPDPSLIEWSDRMNPRPDTEQRR